VGWAVEYSEIYERVHYTTLHYTATLYYTPRDHPPLEHPFFSEGAIARGTLVVGGLGVGDQVALQRPRLYMHMHTNNICIYAGHMGTCIHEGIYTHTHTYTHIHTRTCLKVLVQPSCVHWYFLWPSCSGAACVV
jgi:hypothetical protein